MYRNCADGCDTSIHHDYDAEWTRFEQDEAVCISSHYNYIHCAPGVAS